MIQFPDDSMIQFILVWRGSVPKHEHDTSTPAFFPGRVLRRQPLDSRQSFLPHTHRRQPAARQPGKAPHVWQYRRKYCDFASGFSADFDWDYLVADKD